MTFYDRLEKLRKSYGISQGNLEKELGFSNGSICKWKKSTPKADKIKVLADYFNVTTEYLLTGNEKEGGEKYYLNDETAQIAQELFENKDLKMLFSATRDMSPEDIKAVAVMVEALKRKERNED